MCWQSLMNSRYLVLWRHTAGVFRWGRAVAWHERRPKEKTRKIDDRHVMTLIKTTTQSNQNIVDAIGFFLLPAASRVQDFAEETRLLRINLDPSAQKKICSTDSIGAGSIEPTSTVEKMQDEMMVSMGMLLLPSLTRSGGLWSRRNAVSHREKANMSSLRTRLPVSGKTGERAPKGALSSSCTDQGFTKPATPGQYSGTTISHTTPLPRPQKHLGGRDQHGPGTSSFPPPILWRQFTRRNISQ